MNRIDEKPKPGECAQCGEAKARPGYMCGDCFARISNGLESMKPPAIVVELPVALGRGTK